MLRLLRKSKEVAVEFCDRCSRLCDAACRSQALRERARAKVLRYGGRLV
ncbi:MAG: hypothetical protein HOQ28_14100 [Thermoleophilia bacterium]|nr:hypothetical protein [Thermoleophilia bacterium]